MRIRDGFGMMLQRVLIALLLALLAACSDGSDHGSVTVNDSGEPQVLLESNGDIVVRVRCDSGGSFHGFGEQYNATDQRGEVFGLFVNEQGNGRSGSGDA